MSSLVEIENAVELLSPAEKQELLLFVAARLKVSDHPLPPPRRFTREQVAAWIAEDETDWKRVQPKQ